MKRTHLLSLVDLLLDTNKNFTMEINWSSYKMQFFFNQKPLTKRHIEMFKIQRMLEENYIMTEVSFWRKGRIEERIKRYSILSKHLAALLSRIRLFSITEY